MCARARAACSSEEAPRSPVIYHVPTQPSSPTAGAHLHDAVPEYTEYPPPGGAVGGGVGVLELDKSPLYDDTFDLQPPPPPTPPDLANNHSTNL